MTTASESPARYFTKSNTHSGETRQEFWGERLKAKKVLTTSAKVLPKGAQSIYRSRTEAFSLVFNGQDAIVAVATFEIGEDGCVLRLLDRSW